jgi:predicted flap endonuclease-1-like 5' DNA nuclease
LKREGIGATRTVLAVLIGVIAAVSGVVLLGWLLWRLWAEDQAGAPAMIEIEVPDAGPLEAPVEAEEQEDRTIQVSTREEMPPRPEEADDLKAVEGIGPKISQVLQEAGVRTFAQLAATDTDQIRAILSAVDPRLGRLADPSTWPHQAALAAGGDWEALRNLQSELKGGRRA